MRWSEVTFEHDNRQAEVWDGISATTRVSGTISWPTRDFPVLRKPQPGLSDLTASFPDWWTVEIQ